MVLKFLELLSIMYLLIHLKHSNRNKYFFYIEKLPKKLPGKLKILHHNN